VARSRRFGPKSGIISWEAGTGKLIYQGALQKRANRALLADSGRVRGKNKTSKAGPKSLNSKVVYLIGPVWGRKRSPRTRGITVSALKMGITQNDGLLSKPRNT